MKRDIDLIRELLLEAEKKENPTGYIIPKVDGYTPEQIAYHIYLLSEAGYIDFEELTTKDGFSYGIVNLTWEGHEFLDASRDNTNWKKAKDLIGPKVSSVSFEIIKAVLISFAKEKLGL